MAWLAASGNGPFAVAILVMLGLTLVELVTLVTGFSVNDLVDEFVVSHAGLETSAPTGMETTTAEAQGIIGRFLSWLYVGRVPVLMVLIVWLTVFGVTGLVLQNGLRAVVGGALPAALAGPGVFVLTLPLVRAAVGGLARIIPRDESSAVSPDSFVGRTALVAGGTARKEIGRAHV